MVYLCFAIPIYTKRCPFANVHKKLYVIKFTKTKTIYPTDDAVRKSVYMSIQEISKKWSMPIRDRGTIIGQLIIFFDDRMRGKLAS